MMHSEIVIVGCGNPLFGDDGFGPAVIEEMEKLTLPDNVTIQDGGAGAPHFIFNFLNPEVTKKLIVVDIADFNAKPGSISKISGKDLRPGAYIDPHSWDGVDQLCRIRDQIDTTVVLCQPAKAIKKGDADVEMELSDDVRNAIPKAIKVILETIGVDYGTTINLQEEGSRRGTAEACGYQER
ncbi:coenzyme F420-reducing hydrogenase, FrhD protein [Methanoregula sp.]|uniref:coenzyme F420-reducing hydrogenase, FrhD protein n=1 Tax=Methanoregula sp. TaxID=2052170 RepID=UPI002CCF58D8|nr:coenzyme F420-reducing hydrogenase, FrhD protein [Methanoregula sp.]HVP96834.1 coenzyme F420-reducing hydrogenase, FrhD protein [Methanoregula sp.]